MMEDLTRALIGLVTVMFIAKHNILVDGMSGGGGANTFSSIQLLHQTTMVQDQIEKKGYVCICPDVKRPICGYGKNGQINKFSSICMVKCEASRDKTFSFDVIAGSSCTNQIGSESTAFSLISNRFNTNSMDTNRYTNEWLEYIHNETEFNWDVDKAMEELLEVSGNAVDSRLACVCPGIRRPVCNIGPNGEQIEYANLCVAKCKATRDVNFRFTISVGTFCNRGPMLNILERSNDDMTNHGHGAGRNNSAYMKKWFQLVDEEIRFYKTINNAMQGLLGIQFYHVLVHKLSSSSNFGQDPNPYDENRCRVQCRHCCCRKRYQSSTDKRTRSTLSPELLVKNSVSFKALIAFSHANKSLQQQVLWLGTLETELNAVVDVVDCCTQRHSMDCRVRRQTGA